MATLYAISAKPDQPSYKSIYLYENANFQYDANGNAIRCGEMLLRLRTEKYRDIIQLASVKCTCAALKGRCFEHFLSILIKEAVEDSELFGKKLTPDTKVELFISPDDIPDGVSYETASAKLYKLYHKYGFEIENRNTPSYLIATLGDIELTLRQIPRRSPGRTTSRTPHKTPRKTRSNRQIKMPANKKSLLFQMTLSRLKNISEQITFAN
jgi:hypothetical protein